MLTKIRTQKGFTLIELLIVVAIIGILAAIAIPQFAAYRIKGFNAAAASDVKNAKTAEESLFADNQTYGWSEIPATLAGAVGTGGTGAELVGATPPAGKVFALAGLKADGTLASVGASVSNGVSLIASTIAQNAPPAYVISTKHAQGTRVFVAESASTAIMYAENSTWAGTTLGAPPAGLVGVPAVATTAPSIVSGTTKSGGAPVGTWSAM